MFENAILLLFIFRVTPGVAVINEFPLSLIELVALMFTQELFVMQALTTETDAGTYVPILMKLPADSVVHETFTIDAFTDEILTNDAFLQLKFRKLAVNPHTEFNETLLSLQYCILAFVEKTFVNKHVVIQQFVKLAVLPLIKEQNDVFKFQKYEDTELKHDDNVFVIVLERLPMDA